MRSILCTCGNVYTADNAACPKCSTANPGAVEETSPHKAPRSATAQSRRVEATRHYTDSKPSPFTDPTAITATPGPPKALVFEPIDTNLPGVTILRARVPGGWIALRQHDSTMSPPTFIPLEAW